MGDPGSTSAPPAPEMAAVQRCNSCKKYQCLEWFMGKNTKTFITCEPCRAEARAKQQAKEQGNEWAISIGALEGAAHGQNIAVGDIPCIPPVLPGLAKVTFQKAGMGCPRSQADPFLRLHAAPYCPLPGQKADGYSMEAVLWKLKTASALRKDVKAEIGRHVHDVDQAVQPGTGHTAGIFWTLHKKNSSEQAGVDEVVHSVQGVDVTDQLLQALTLGEESGEKWEFKVPRCYLYIYPDSNCYWELGRGRQKGVSGQKRTHSQSQSQSTFDWRRLLRDPDETPEAHNGQPAAGTRGTPRSDGMLQQLCSGSRQWRSAVPAREGEAQRRLVIRLKSWITDIGVRASDRWGTGAVMAFTGGVMMGALASWGFRRR